VQKDEILGTDVLFLKILNVFEYKIKHDQMIPELLELLMFLLCEATASP